MTEKVQNKNLEHRLKQALFNAIDTRPHYPGYPTTRLTASNSEVASQLASGGILLLPDGPWDAGTRKLKRALSTDEQRLLQLQGYTFDSLGRPLHPWINDMLINKSVGVVTGTGEYWSMGPNKTADPIIIAVEDQPYVMLVQRNDNGLWACPGGFIDPGEDAEQTGRREAFEESGIVVNVAEAVLYDGVVADARTTAYAWAETTALVYRVTQRTTPRIDPNEVSDAHWYPLFDLPAELHGSHGVLLEEAQRYELSRN